MRSGKRIGAGMTCVITFENADGTYDDVGMDNRIPMSKLTTQQGYLRRAATYKRHYRAEFYPTHRPYGPPIKTAYYFAGTCTERDQ